MSEAPARHARKPASARESRQEIDDGPAGSEQFVRPSGHSRQGCETAVTAALNGRLGKTLGWRTRAETVTPCCNQFRLYCDDQLSLPIYQ